MPRAVNSSRPGFLRWLVAWLPTAWAELDRSAEPRRPFGRFEAGAVVIACVGLSVMWFLGQELYYLRWYGRRLLFNDSPFYELFGLVHWVGFCVIGYVLIPALYLLVTGRSIREYAYLGVAGLRHHVGGYFALFVLVLAPVAVVSFTKDYQAIYPFYTNTGRSWLDLVAWELAYGVQFFALEFFFRGFLLETLRRSLGHAAIYVMLAPYCMLHFQKTMSESLAAIIAGIVLATMAMRFRSIWGGVCLHWGVAISMDLASLLQKGKFPPPVIFP